jgi:competence protein ComFB
MEIFNRDGIDYIIEDCSVSDIYNHNEVIVLKVIRDTLQEDPSLCRCPICIEDIFALSLNALPPRYIQSTSIEKYIHSPNYIDEKRVRRKVMEAWEKIKAKPGH